MRWTVSDVMTSHVVTVTPATDFKSVAQLLQAYNIASVPVVDSYGHVAGIVSEADMIAKASWKGGRFGRLQRWLLPDDEEKASALTADDLMTREVVTIGPDADVHEAARLMRTHLLKALPVVGDDRLLKGVISRADIIKTYARSDWEIREEIQADVLRGTLWIDSVVAIVHAGRVTLSGLVESRSLAAITSRLVEAVPGVVSVDNRLQWSNDDRHPRFDHEPADELTYTGVPLR